MKRSLFALFAFVLLVGCQPGADQNGTTLRIVQDGDDLKIMRAGASDAILTQNAKQDHRPFLHPIVAPDGNGVLTEYSPGHHPHQTGLYWGFTRVNGRDYFHNPQGDYWQRVAVDIVADEGAEVKWRTVYHLLDDAGDPIMEETQLWTMREGDGKYFLNLDWMGEAMTDITIGEFDYGGLFLRMPWTDGIEGEAVNAARQRNRAAEGKRAMWMDVGMKVEGREDLAHIAIFDNPQNAGFPQPWRVDDQLGVGPVRARDGDWHIPAGQAEIIKHHLVVYTGPSDDAALREAWEAYSGQGAMYSTASLWGIAQQEGLEAEFLTPERAVEEMTMLDGFEVNAWAGEPMMTQPMAFTWDDRGRLWIAENRDYESRGTGFSNSGDSKILILEDTDRDGKADSRKVFLEGIPFPAAIAVGFDGLFLGAPPHLMFIPDKDQDDVADMEDIEILLTGWGIRDRHETINSLHWGPDGWLYGLEGFATPSKIRKPGPEERLYKHNDPFPDVFAAGEGVDIDGGVWRYHPTKDRFEVVAHGFSNPWGIDHDAKGQLFITACVIPHVFHVIPGGIYHRQGGQHFNPYVYSDIQTIVDHRHRSAHGGARVYQSDAFPEEHHGRLFMANIHEHAVLTDVLTPEGSGFVASHGDDFLLANNAQWIGFSMEIGPDGGVYVLDWHDADICGKDVHDKDTGRIFRIVPTNSLAEEWDGRYDDLRNNSDLQLAELQESKSDWHARRARVILQHRAAEGEIDGDAIAQLRSTFGENPNQDYRLRGMWALHVTDQLSVDDLMEGLNDSDEHIRAWSIQLLTEDMDAGNEAIEKFGQMARSDRSPVVRKYLAAALQRIDEDNRWTIAENLSNRAEDADDHNIPKLIWFGMEPLVAANPARALALTGGMEIPMVAEHVGRRSVDAGALEELVAALEEQKRARPSLLKGMRAGLSGRTDIDPPSNWQAVYSKLQSDRAARDIAAEVAQSFGDAESVRQMLAVLEDDSASLDQRIGAMNGLANLQRGELVAALPALIDTPETRLDAIRAVAAYSDAPLGMKLLEEYDSYSEDEQTEVILTMASRPVYGWLLTQALKENPNFKSEVPAYVARQLRRVVGNGFVEVWGPIDDISADREAQYARYQALLTADAIAGADLMQGEAQFQQTCGACHVMFGEGGIIGPELTGSNRTNLDYLLSNILSPSEVIQDDYLMEVVTTRDGRTYLGNIAAENEHHLTLRVVGQDEVLISKPDIQSRETTPNSLMPEGLLETLTEEQVINLIGYLQLAQGEMAPAE